MTIRKNVSVLQNQWHDAQQVDEQDMELEQEHNNTIHASITQNHIGSGVVLSTPAQTTIFDSENLTTAQSAILAAGNFDGTGMSAHSQPSDSNLGNQLEIELTGSNIFGRLSVKVAIIGLSFDGEVQMDRLYFYANEKQVTSKHYAQILSIFFNDFKGNNNCSRNNGGRIVIRETSSFQLSLDPIMVAQDVQPDIFWRDFKTPNILTPLTTTIQTGMGSVYNVDALDINTTGAQTNRTLAAGDITSQIGQKFKATTNNIQKITLLLGVQRDDTAAVADRYDWDGNLVISIYALQTSVSCPTSIAPSLAIDYDPTSTPIVQLSYDQAALEAIGYVLTDAAQPVDFVFNSTKIASGTTSGIVVGNYYAITIRRSGAATSGTIFAETGTDRIDDSRLTLFSGVWTDVTDEDMWFQIWTDAAKIADGKGYDEGIGIQYDKTITSSTTGSTIDNEVKNKSFVDTGENVLNIGILQATTEESFKEQDERTGSDVFARKQFVPSFSFISLSSLNTLKETLEPFIIGCAKDTNPKQNTTLEKLQTIPGLASGDTFCIINPDADLLSLNLIGSVLHPNYPCDNPYRIFKVEYCTDGYGDVNGDGDIDSSDIAAATTLVGESIYYSSTQQKIIDGYFTTLEVLRADVDGDGYVTSADVDLITSFVNKTTNSFPAGTSFTHLCLTLQHNVGRYDGYYDCDGYVRLDGYSGTNIVNPSTLSASELLYYGNPSDVLLQNDTDFIAVPFKGVTYRIEPQPYWQPYLIGIDGYARNVPVIFSYDSSPTNYSCTAVSATICSNRPDLTVTCDPGRNDLYIPNNLIIDNGQILNTDGTHHAVDLEIGTIILQLPDDPLDEVSLNVFEKLVADSNNTGYTVAGYPAMKYADCSNVQPGDLAAGRVKFAVAIQAFVPAIDGYDGYTDDGYTDGYGIIIDDIIGVYFSQSTGILTLTAKDMYVDNVFKSLVTKIEITVYLKKAGWRDNFLEISPTETNGLFSS